MKSPLRLLLLEDDSSDAELIRELLEADRFTCEVTRVQTRAEFVAALENGGFDLILADYKLPAFDGLSALKLAQSARRDLPFIFVSGTLGEEVAIEALKIGATDYVLKTRLSRLVPAVDRALREAEQRAERKKAEEALRRSEAYLAEAQELSHTGSLSWDMRTGDIFWSDETGRIFGCDPATKPTAQLVIDRTHPHDRVQLRQVIDRAATERSGFAIEMRLIMLDGAIKHVRVVAHRAAGEDPESLRYAGAIVDITERKHAESTLREQTNLLDLTHDAIFVHDTSGVITYWNRGAEALYGWAAEEARGKSAPELLKTIFPEPFELKGGRWEGELVRTTKAGTKVVVASRWSLQRDDKDTPIAILETNNDITERKRAEEAVRQSEKELRDLIENVPAMMFIALPGPSNEFVSRRWREYTGLSAEDTAGSGWQRVVHPDDLQRHLKKWHVRAAAGEPFEDEARFRSVASGKYRWFLVRAVPRRDESGKIGKWYGSVTDIEDLMRAEQALRRSEAYLTEAQKLTHTGGWAYRADSRTAAYWSEESFRIWGFDPQQGLPDIDAVFQRVHPEDRERVVDTFQIAMREGRGFAIGFKIVLPNGTVRHLDGLGHPVFSANGEPVELVGTYVDVTERKHAEEEREKLHRLEADLARINRVGIMGELAASLAHEIKQPIAAAAMNAAAALAWLRRDPPDLAEASQTVSRIAGDVTRAATIVDRNYSLYMRGARRPELIDLNQIIRQMVGLLHDAANRHSIPIRIELDPQLPATAADPVQLQQVLMNLMLNGIDAMKDKGGELRVASKRTEDGGLAVSVSDTGIGLPAEEPERVFEAFFTTKPQGTGMGLSISRRIIESHGGRLWASANAPRGAIFQFTVPLNSDVAS